MWDYKAVAATGAPAKVLAVVGGFSESPYLQRQFKEKFKSTFSLVIFPPKGGNAVVRGSVLYGLEPGALFERCTRRTYGVEMNFEAKDSDKFEHKCVVGTKVSFGDCLLL